MEKDSAEVTSNVIMDGKSLVASFNHYLSMLEELIKAEGVILDRQDNRQWLAFCQTDAKKMFDIIVELKKIAVLLQDGKLTLPSELLDRYTKISKIDAERDPLRRGIANAYVEISNAMEDRGLKC